MPLSDLLSPHYCCSCGEIGAVLCEHCKYDIISEPFDVCLKCGKAVGVSGNVCSDCRPPYSHAWCVGFRSEGLKKLVDIYKFERVRAAHGVLAELFDECIPFLPADIIVTPIPTIRPHIRIRGYDHIELLARSFAKARTLTYRPTLKRISNSVQRGASKKVRDKQASMAFEGEKLTGERILLMDDVYTTGATVKYAAQKLLDNGAGEVWVAVLSRQTIGK